MAVNDNKQAQLKRIAFKYFLEKGYEATNMRKISAEIGIKASSIYFYYDSKQALFMSVLNDILSERYEAVQLQMARDLKIDVPPIEKLYMLLNSSIKACAENSAPFKFILRYRIFPEEGIALSSREQFENWRNEEYELCKSIYDELSIGLPQYDSKLLFHHFKRFQSSMLNEILLSGIMLDDRTTQKFWQMFWSNLGI
ncbi:TetR/AcrR family transcriptional regulator [Fusibacter paucivorans]|uniref:TetR/AcrR family transcriptional regulator n=1 Tax=Fusibacter paucivorans TaxID=76009 RepID=A0ABS5PLW3_9FIRM|nr:TetR/AcrR family transcriptional regulator [Fusibacter paucivorans]MBS7526170.1 TetR/AcrR family transcriptional regulator [Fusibacter paucivorans]